MDRKTYTFDEAFKASLDYFKGDELAAKVWVNKYALKDAFGNIYEQSPVDMHHRLANEIARIEEKYPNPLSKEELFDLFDHFRYIVPQLPSPYKDMRRRVGESRYVVVHP